MSAGLSFVRWVKHWLIALNDPLPLAGVLQMPRYVAHWRRYKRLARGERLRLKDSYPCFRDVFRRTPFDPHYLFQGAWLARKLRAASAAQHIDVGSSVMTISAVSAMVDIVFVDYRPLQVKLPGLSPLGADITRLPFRTDSVRSLSCLHVLEHIGLGRYGDSIDPGGSARAAAELVRVLQPGGRLYLSVPVGRERVCFNAHRVFHPETISLRFFQRLTRVSFALIDDSGQFRADASDEQAARCEYGCGLFEFTK